MIVIMGSDSPKWHLPRYLDFGNICSVNFLEKLSLDFFFLSAATTFLNAFWTEESATDAA